MKTRLQVLLQAIPVALFVTMLFGSRRWLRRQPNATQARYRLLGMSEWLIAFASIGFALANFWQPSPDWSGTLSLFLLIALIELERSRLRPQIYGTSGHHDA